MEHENEHLDIREKLLRLPKLQADDNFLKRLQIQIDVLDSEERTRDVVVKGSASGYFKNLFGARLMPALGISSVVVAAFLVYFILADKKDAVVNNMTSNKTPQTTITTEKPGITNSAPITGNNELAKTEEKTSDKDSKDKTGEKKSDNYGMAPDLDKISQPVVTTQNELAQELKSKTSGVVQDERGGQINIRGGRSSENLIIIDSNVTAKGNIKQNTEYNKTSDSELKDQMAPHNPTSSVEQEKEKSVNEGGRGNTDTKTPDPKTPKASLKPKKKDLDGVTNINKSVLESLRNKLK